MASRTVVWLLMLTIFDVTLANKNDFFPASDAAKQLLLENEVGDSFLAHYRSMLMNQTRSFSRLGITSECLGELLKIKADGKKLLSYIDAAGKPAAGIARDNVVWLGSYSECLAMSDAKYCLSTITLDAPSLNFTLPKITWGTCFPKNCSEADIYEVIRYFLIPEVKRATGVEIIYKGLLCPGGPQYTTGVKVTLVFCGILLLICLVGTVLDLIIEEKKEMKVTTSQLGLVNGGGTFPQERPNLANLEDEHEVKGSNPALMSGDNVFLLPPPASSFSHTITGLSDILEVFRDFFLCFSLIRNSQRIFNMNVPPKAITSINGIRVISMTWVILGHTFLIFGMVPVSENKLGLLEDSQLFSIMPVINAYYSVDSFFFLSGLLVAYTCFRKIEKSGGALKFNWFLFYFHRFWRLTPSYMAVILISIQLKRFLAEGPLWFSQYEDKMCKEYWWTNLLYINNFHPNDIEKTCIGWTWYLANDMQFFVITPPLLILVHYLGWLGMLGPGFLMTASTVATAAIYGYYNLDPLSSLRFQRTRPPEVIKKGIEYSRYVYSKPWCRIQPYLVGFILGYFIYKTSEHFFSKRRRLLMFWLVTVCGWMVAAALAWWLVYGPHDFIVHGAKEWPLAARVVYGATERLLWGLVLAWVVFACHFGGGGIVKKFLSAKFWIPLSRLSYSVYLVHLIVLIVALVGARGTIHYDFFTVSYYFVACVVLSYGAGFILAVTIEYPCENFEMMVLNLIRGRQR